MAPVSRDRAQLLLVGGLVVAVGLVALAIILNSGIYTHNLASRVDPTASEAVGHTAVVRDSVEGLVEYAVRNNPDDVTAQTEGVTGGVSTVSDVLARDAAGRAVLTNATVVATHEGRKVSQSSDREFTDAGPNTEWVVARDADSVREFEMNVTRGDLADQDGILFGAFSSATFNVSFQPATGHTYNVSVYRDSGAGTTEVAVTNATSGRSFGPCTNDESRTEIDLTGATVGGEHCPALERLGSVTEPFDVEFTNADNVYGTYSLVANTTNTPGNMGSPGPGEEDTLYSVLVEVRFQSQRVDYRTTVTVAPGEIDA